MNNKRIYFTVTNDLSYDQRMIRIGTSLAKNGYLITLVGRHMKDSIALDQLPFRQKRIRCFFQKGKLFYAEYNIKLFFFLWWKKMDAICAIDLDTILPCYFISVLKKIPRVYDAHELFCEMKEVVSRPKIYAFWKKIEQFAVPKFKIGYTVNTEIAAELQQLYGVHYSVVRSIAVLSPLTGAEKNEQEKYLLYQGAVNEGRSFETLIPAMQFIPMPLIICGDGNFMQQAQQLVQQYGLAQKVIFKGKVPPDALRSITEQAYIGTTLFEPDAKSNYLSLANRFFDYLHAGIPQVCVNYPAYQTINNLYEIGVLIPSLSAATIAQAVNELVNDEKRYDKLKANCLQARQQLNWQEEEKKLLHCYQQIFN
jgi:glycosyltransferase involved in cell wall biosynthesis